MSDVFRTGKPRSSQAAEPDALPRGKVKAMVYIPPETHAAVRLLAARRGCRISDVYAEAAAAYLSAMEAPPPVRDEGSSLGDAEALASLTKAVERQGELVEELLDKVGGLADVDPAKASHPPMMLDTAGWAVATGLRLLVNAGEAGALKAEIREMGSASGRLRLGLENALYALRGVGLARNLGPRWWACWPPVQGTHEPFIRGKHAEPPRSR